MSVQQELRKTRQETENVKEYKLKDLIIVHCYQFDDEMIAVKSCKSPDYSGLNGWQSITIETEYGDAQVDKADENSQSLETYDAMRKTTEVSARRKTRSWSKSTSTHATEDDDIVEFPLGSLKKSQWNRRLKTKC